MLADWADEAQKFDPTLRTRVEMFADTMLQEFPPETSHWRPMADKAIGVTRVPPNSRPHSI